MSDQRAMLDSCTSSPDCRGEFHLLCCPSTSRRPDPQPEPEPLVQSMVRAVGRAS